jgi:hypothetical protein
MNGFDAILANGKTGNVEERSTTETAIGRKKRKE